MKTLTAHRASQKSRLISALMLVTPMTLGIGHVALAEDGVDHSYIAPMVSYVIADDERMTDDAFGGLLAFGRRFSSFFGAELRASYLDYGDSDETGALCATLNIGCTSESVSVGSVGLGLNFYPLDSGLYVHLDAMGGDHAQYHAGLGYDFGALIGRLGLRAEALYLSTESLGETRFNLGLHIPFGSKASRPNNPLPPPPTPTPQPPRVVAPPPCEMPAPGEPLSLTGCKINDSIVLEGLEFEIDSAEIRSDEQASLDRSSDALKDRPEIKIEVHGHTDSTAPDAYNQALSERRAESVKAYLVDDGIAGERITTRGFGESKPVADNDTDEGRARNRRVELMISERTSPRSTVTTTAKPTAAPTPSPTPAAEPERSSAAPTTPVAEAAATPEDAISKDNLIAQGEAVFNDNCAVCHQSNGQGSPPAFPSLVGSFLIKGPPAAQIRQVLNGKRAMPSFADDLSDDEIAAVITYTRNSWGNDAGTVQPAAVAAQR
ncbi:OmpA family protein [Polycyclovorans algicola]|uniref:OmpA family protein n=1 Tax=Polycyclovorans algicola TaxID=616992 RepID=UPI000693E9B6|nr:OmpA family protein [Polycyclovorans algicola]